MTFSPLSEALPRILEHVSRSDATRRRWSSLTGRDCSRPDEVAALLLLHAARANENGVVLFSASTPERIAWAARSVQADPHQESALEAFERLIDAEVRVTSREAEYK